MSAPILPLLLLALTTGVSASDMDAARQEYDEGRYAQASESYQRLIEASPHDPSLHYDLGNALFKAGKLGRAVASYERAFALDPQDHDTRFNLEFALKLAGEDFVPSGAPPVLYWAFTALSERELAGLHWLAAWSTLVIAGLMLLSRDDRRKKLTPWTAALASAWLFFGFWWSGLRAVLPPDRGVIVTPRAEVRHGPGPGFGVAFTVPEGRRVRVLGFSGAWLEVGVLKEGAKGWIQSAAVERL